MACVVLGLQVPPVAQVPDRDLVERQEVHRVQIDVSVIDPRGSTLSSVPGLTKSDFRLQLDGRPIEGAALDRVEFDEICPAKERTEKGVVRDDARPSIIVVADLNFLSAAERHATARAIRDLAGMARKAPIRVKVLAYGRTIAELTDDFTTDPAAIELAAERLVARISSTPRVGGLEAAPPPPMKKGDKIDPTPLEEQADSGRPLDPDRVRQAFEVEVPTVRGGNLPEPPRVQFPFAKPGSLAEMTVDPRPSLTAIEAILLSHASIRGRKALVIFSNSWFDIPEEYWLTYAVSPRQAAQGGFMIWAVDARGLGGGSASHESRLMAFISTSTGGEFIGSAGRLSIAFEHALEQLSCYYLFSIPVVRPSAGTVMHDVDVRLDTRKRPEWWGYRVRTASEVTLLDDRQLRTRRSLAALLEPEAYRFPEVRVTASYPSGQPAASQIEVGTVLSDLTFTPGSDGRGLEARMRLEGLVTDAAGRTVCRIGDGQERTIRSEQQPARFPVSLLIATDLCVLPGPGVYEVRVVVEDLGSESFGAGRARLEFAPLEPGLAVASSLRAGRNSGRDFLLEKSPAPVREVQRDEARRGFVPLLAGEPAVASDRLKLRFVGCGLAGDPEVRLVRRPASSSEAVAAVVSRRGEQRGKDVACVEYEAVVREATLEPGGYQFVVVDPGRDGGGKRALASLDVEVVPGQRKPPEQPGQQV